MSKNQGWMDSGHNVIMLDGLKALRDAVVAPVGIRIKFHEWDSKTNCWRHFSAVLKYIEDNIPGSQINWNLKVTETTLSGVNLPRETTSNPTNWNCYISGFPTFKQAALYLIRQLSNNTSKIQSITLE